MARGLWRVIFGVLLLAACAPTPESLVVLPTLAVIPTETATSTPSQTPRPTLTRTPSATPLPPNTPRPTATPVLRDYASACAQTQFAALEQAVLSCPDLNAGRSCHASSPLDVMPQLHLVEDGQALLLNPGNQADNDDIASIGAEPLNANSDLWGIAVSVLDRHRNGTVPEGEFVGMVIFGGTSVTNRSPSDETFATETAPLPMDRRPEPPAPPLTDLLVLTQPNAAICPFVPNGLLIQSTIPADFIVNGTAVTVNGTAYITAQPLGAMQIIALEGEVHWTALERRRTILAGAGATLNVDSNMTALEPPSALFAASNDVMTALITRAGAIFTLLDHRLEIPPPLPLDAYILLDDYSDEWAVAVRIERLDGLWVAGEPQTAELLSEVIEVCDWEAAQLLLRQFNSELLVYPFGLRVDDSLQTLTLNAYYPGVLFPPTFTRTANEPPTYTATLNGIGTALFTHEISFPSPTEMRWRVEVAGLDGGGLCSGGLLTGVGTRQLGDAQPAAPVTEISRWQVQFSPEPVYLPDDAPLPDCFPADALASVPAEAEIALSEDGATGTATLEGEIAGLPLPILFTRDLFDPTTYVSETIGEDLTYRYRLRFTVDGVFEWRIMALSTGMGCR
ncbi:MAG: hypothetical protein ACOYL5_09970, partial [Phototrophicaceae bacterium]